MINQGEGANALGLRQAYQLSDIVKTRPQLSAITPRYLSRALEWKGLETGVFRLNTVKDCEAPIKALCAKDAAGEDIPEGYVDYDEQPKEYLLNSITAIVRVSAQVSDLYGKPYDQAKEQLRLSSEALRERQESLLINSRGYGLLKTAPPCQRIRSLSGRPTPDDLDELITKVWKQPSFFLAHPRAIAAFGRECTRRGVPPATVNMFDTAFLTWRGLPVFPSDKLFIDGENSPNGGKTNILLIRTGECKQGVIGLYQSNLEEEQSKGLSVRFMGIDNQGIGSYLLSLYSSAAALSYDAVGVLENVEVGHYYEYKQNG